MSGCIGAGKDCSYSRARRGIGASGALGTPRGVGGSFRASGGVMGVLGACRDSILRNQKGIGALGLLGGVGGCFGV